jgi:hypothetical protein
VNLLCLSGDGLSASLFAAALHFGWTPADGVAREESWLVYQRRFEFLAERVWKGGEWEHRWPARATQPRLVLDRRGLRADYVVCGEMWCKSLESLMPRARAPVVEIVPC